MAARVDQLNAVLQERIGRFLLTHFEAPHGVLVTITKVKTASDFSTANVYVTILPDGRLGSTLAALRRVTPALRHWLSRELTIRSVPRVKFVTDEVERQAGEVEELLDHL